MSQTLNERFDLTASIMTSSLLESGFFYENLAFSARSCGFFFYLRIVFPWHYCPSYHHLKKCCHTGKQALSWLAWYSSISNFLWSLLYLAPLPSPQVSFRTAARIRDGSQAWSCRVRLWRAPILRLNFSFPLFGWGKDEFGMASVVVLCVFGKNDKAEWERTKKAPWGHKAILSLVLFPIPSALDVSALGHTVSVSLLFSQQHKHYSCTKYSERWTKEGLRQHERQGICCWGD